MLLTPAQIKSKSFESRRNSFFLLRVDAPHVHVRAWVLGCFYMQSYQYPNLSEGADRVGGQLCADKECPFSGVTKSGRVWRKVPESDARSMSCMVCRTEPVFGGRCRKAMLEVWVVWCVAQNLCLEEGAGKRCSEYELYGVSHKTCAEVAAVCGNAIRPRQLICATGTSHHLARYSNAL